MQVTFRVRNIAHIHSSLTHLFRIVKRNISLPFEKYSRKLKLYNFLLISVDIIKILFKVFFIV